MKKFFKYLLMILIELKVKRSNYYSITETAYDTKKIFFPIFVKLGFKNVDWLIRRIYYFFRYNFIIHEKRRNAIKNLYLKFFTPLNNNILFIHQYGIYKLKNHKNSKNALCFGIGEDIFFEEFLATKLDFNVLAGDPTPISKRFMQDKKNIKNLNYIPEAIWVENKNKKFYVADNFNNDMTYDGDGSLTNYRNTESFIEVKCRNLEHYINELKIDEIDVLKMDIEGAAIEILEDCVDKNLFPNQITGEIEIHPDHLSNSISRIDKLLENLKRNYIFFLFDQKVRFSKFEFLMVKKNLINPL